PACFFYAPSSISPSSLFFHRSRHHRHLHSFPTRRSSDLNDQDCKPRFHISLKYIIVPFHSCIHSCADQSTSARKILYRMPLAGLDRKSTRLNSSHVSISYAVFCLKKKKKNTNRRRPTYYS